MGLLLNLICFVFLVLLFIICVAGWLFYQSFRGMIDRLKGEDNQSARHNPTESNDFGDEVIVDQRNPREAKKKIFSAGEGEYVDFEEDR